MGDTSDPANKDDKTAAPLPGVRVTAAKCVRCTQPVQPRYRPFCSQRCADIDLGSWFTGAYRVPSHDVPDSSDGEEGSENR